MKAYGHDPGCDGQHMARQRCNARALNGASPALAVDLDAPPEQVFEPASEADVVAEEQHQGAPQAPALAVPAAGAEARGPAFVPQARDAPAPDAPDTASQHAVADGPVETIDTRQLPIMPVVALVALAATCAIVAWRVLLRRRR